MTVTKLKMKLKNKSGIHPAGNRVVIFADQIEDGLKTERIELPEDVKAKYQAANASGILIAVGPDVFQHRTEWVYHIHGDNREELVEKRVSGYSEPFAQPGDRISWAKYAGKIYDGADGKRYLVMNDTDITCRLDDGVKLTDLDARKGAGL